MVEVTIPAIVITLIVLLVVLALIYVAIQSEEEMLELAFELVD